MGLKYENDVAGFSIIHNSVLTCIDERLIENHSCTVTGWSFICDQENISTEYGDVYVHVGDTYYGCKRYERPDVRNYFNLETSNVGFTGTFFITNDDDISVCIIEKKIYSVD